MMIMTEAAHKARAVATEKQKRKTIAASRLYKILILIIIIMTGRVQHLSQSQPKIWISAARAIVPNRRNHTKKEIKIWLHTRFSATIIA